jgi:hypothetical protein
MAATYVTEAELRSTLGIENLYSSTVVEEVCQAAENVIKGYLWFNNTPNIAHSNTASPNATGTIYFEQKHEFYVGETVVISGNGSKFNGSKTITAVGEKEITFAITGNNITARPYHPVAPYGLVAGDTYVDYSIVPEVRQGSLMIAVDIWQSRQLSSTGGMSPDGFSPAPWRMSNSMVAKIRGLIANWINPAGLLG